MKYLIAAGFMAASFAAAGQSWAQGYVTSIERVSPSMTIIDTPAMPYSMVMDDGSSSDYPIHMPGDWSANRLNREQLQTDMTIIIPR